MKYKQVLFNDFESMLLQDLHASISISKSMCCKHKQPQYRGIQIFAKDSLKMRFRCMSCLVRSPKFVDQTLSLSMAGHKNYVFEQSICCKVRLTFQSMFQTSNKNSISNNNGSTLFQRSLSQILSWIADTYSVWKDSQSPTLN